MTRENKSAAGPLVIAVLAILLPLFYFLSIGPAVALIEYGYVEEDNLFVQAYGWPSCQACERSSTFYNLMCGYARMWAPEESAYKYSP